MRRIIAALQTSVDGFIEGPNGELDWAMADDEETWIDMNETLSLVDTFILGRGMYPAYEQYWLALLDNPTGTKNENAYARHADKIPHRSFQDPRQGCMEGDTDRSGRGRNTKNEAAAWQRHVDVWRRYSSIQSNESGLDR